jgi:prophage maintenance system killer protein
LLDTPYDVTPGSEVMTEFNKYIQKKIVLDNDTKIFDYIMECIDVMVDLIKLQPFNDGNKRTCRAVLNLLLKQIGIPPIYIKQEEREVYKTELLNAICNHDYSGLYQFYFYKIADSIVSLDIKGEDNKMIYTNAKRKHKG